MPYELDNKTVLCELRETLEDLEDRMELARAIKCNGDKPGIPWEQVRMELGLEDLREQAPPSKPA